jgi:hypothetical protein
LAKLYLSTLNPQTAHLQTNTSANFMVDQRTINHVTLGTFQNDMNSKLIGNEQIDLEDIEFIEPKAAKNRICSLDKLIQEKSTIVENSLDALKAFRIESTKNITFHLQDHLLNKFNTLNWFY